MTADHDQTNPPTNEFDFSSYPQIRSSTTGAKVATAGIGATRRRPGRPRPGNLCRGPTPEEGTPPPDRPHHLREAVQRRRDGVHERHEALQGTLGHDFPSHADVIKVAVMLVHRRAVFEYDLPQDDNGQEPSIIMASPDHN